MNNIACIIACWKYGKSDTWKGLSNISSDVDKMEKALIEYCACTRENIFKWTDAMDRSMTKDDLRDAIDSLHSQKENIDNLYIYFTGHGIKKDEKLYFLTSDVTDSGSDPLQGCNDVDEIVSYLVGKLHAEKTVVFLDICQNDKQREKKGVARADALKKTRTISETFDLHHTVIKFYACYPDRSAYTIPARFIKQYGRGSIFTECLARALKDYGKVGDIATFLKGQMKTMSQTFGLYQDAYAPALDPSLYEEIIAHFDELRLDETEIVVPASSYNENVAPESMSEVQLKQLALYCAKFYQISWPAYSDADIEDVRLKLRSIYNEINCDDGWTRLQIRQEVTVIEEKVDQCKRGFKLVEDGMKLMLKEIDHNSFIDLLDDLEAVRDGAKKIRTDSQRFNDKMKNIFRHTSDSLLVANQFNINFKQLDKLLREIAQTFGTYTEHKQQAEKKLSAV